MQPFNVTTSPVPAVREPGLGVGAGASIVMAVAASLAGFVALLVAAHAAPASAATLAADAAPAADGGSLAAIAIVALIAGWAAATADLWRSLFNRVRTWALPRF